MTELHRLFECIPRQALSHQIGGSDVTFTVNSWDTLILLLAKKNHSILSKILYILTSTSNRATNDEVKLFES